MRCPSITVNNGEVEQEDAPLSVLKKPAQARPVATFANILDAATSIIMERGVKGLNTNLVAERAGINIGTVYHYFANKNAILTELLGIQQSQRDDVLFEKLDALPDTQGVQRVDAHHWTQIGERDGEVIEEREHPRQFLFVTQSGETFVGAASPM